MNRAHATVRVSTVLPALVALLALVAAPPPAAAAQEPGVDRGQDRARDADAGPGRADATLRFLLMSRPPDGDPGAGLAADAAAPGGDLLAPLLDRAGGIVRVRTLVRLGPGGETALLQAGAEIGTRAGDIVTARIPLDAVPDLLRTPSIRAMEAATVLRPLVSAFSMPAAAAASASVPAPSAADPEPPPLDSAGGDAGFGELRSRVGERWEGLAGQGGVVGIYDGGLDLDHEDFLDPAGHTRVVFAWDQSVEGSGPGMVGDQTFTYGVECGAAGIDEGECPLTDPVGHGTHVAGIAAGDGSATGAGRPRWRFPGGAPAADLIVVKGGEQAFTADRLVDGVAYIFARAAALGRPAVVNVSLSSQAGPHDGTTLLEQALDALSGPGRIVVSGSGNAGDFRNTFPVAVNGPNHAEGVAGAAGSGIRVPSYDPVPGDANDAALAELWYDGADSVAITVRSPDGASVTVATGDTASLLTDHGAVVIDNALDGPASNGDHGALIGIVDAEADAPPVPGLWEIEVDPVALHDDGRWHLWLIGGSFDSDTLTVLEGQTSNRYLVGVPAGADRVLAAGAHVTRHEWLGVDGEVESFPAQETLGDIAYFSSPGPRRDGVTKPDVTAPGKVVISSLAEGASLFAEFPWLVEADSVHVGSLGTSMASPQLAAAVAILLQLEPTLTPEQAREALRLSAATDALVADVLPDPAWGAGKLDVAAAAERIRPGGLAAAGEAVSLSANPVRSDALVVSYESPPRSIAVYTLIGERVRSFGPGEVGPLTTVWGLDTDRGGDVANGAYVLVVEMPGERVVRKLLVARP